MDRASNVRARRRSRTKSQRTTVTKYTLPNEMLDAMRDESTFLRVKPDGFDDGGTIRPELACTVLDAKFAVKQARRLN